MHETTKFCPDCKTVKPTADFYLTGSGRLFSYCKPCGYARAQRWKKNPETRGAVRAALGKPEDIWPYLDEIVGECWPVKAGVYRNEDGYGVLGLKKRGRQLVHRIAWEAANGAIPKGMLVCHKCDNPPCCNPDHLFLGSEIDNVRDMIAKGRRVTRAVTVPAAVSESGLRSKEAMFYHRSKGLSLDQIATHPRTRAGRMAPTCTVCGGVGHTKRHSSHKQAADA